MVGGNTALIAWVVMPVLQEDIREYDKVMTAQVGLLESFRFPNDTLLWHYTSGSCKTKNFYLGLMGTLLAANAHGKKCSENVFAGGV